MLQHWSPIPSAHSSPLTAPNETPVGWLCLMEARPAHHVVELGYVLYTPRCNAPDLAPRRSTSFCAMSSRISATAASNGPAP